MAGEAVKIPFIEAAAPSTPAASRVVIYAKSDGLMYSKDDAGSETLMSAGGAGISATILDAKGDLIAASAADTAAKLTVGTNAMGLVAASGETTGLKWVEILPWHILIIPMSMTPDATTGTWTNANTSQQSTFPFYSPGSVANSGNASLFQNNTGTAQNDAAAWDVILAAGTWSCRIITRKHSAAGIITLQQDGSDMGTTDLYDAAGALGDATISGWTVSTTGKHRMNFKAATKNASSSNYFIGMMSIAFRRTA